MPPWSPTQRISNSLFGLAAITSVSAGAAGDRLYDGDVHVTLKAGVPCFYVDASQSDRSKFGISVSVKNSADVPTWGVDNEKGQEPLPVSKATCVQYGSAWPLAKTVTPPQPLHDNTAYAVWINSEKLWHGTFCITHTNDGHARVMRWNDAATGCSTTPVEEPERRSIWQRFFGS